jgi:hypothetical protein
VADIWLHEAVCRQRPEMWLTVGYMKLCVDRDLKSGRDFFREKSQVSSLEKYMGEGYTIL